MSETLLLLSLEMLRPPQPRRSHHQTLWALSTCQKRTLGQVIQAVHCKVVQQVSSLHSSRRKGIILPLRTTLRYLASRIEFCQSLSAVPHRPKNQQDYVRTKPILALRTSSRINCPPPLQTRLSSTDRIFELGRRSSPCMKS